MTFQEIVDEITARGFDYILTSRIEDFAQRSVSMIEARYQWPWSEAEKEQAAPIEISDLRYVLSVKNKSNEAPLYGATRQWLEEKFPKLDEASIPLYWFLDDKTLRVFPTSTSEKVNVRYVKKPIKLTAEDEPAAPEEWHYLFVDQAVVFCLRDNDEYQEARALNEDVRAGLREMLSDQLSRNLQNDRLITRTDYWPGSYL